MPNKNLDEFFNNSEKYTEEYYEKLCSLIEKEKQGAEEVLTSLGLSWTQDFHHPYPLLEHEKELIDSYNKGEISLKELFDNTDYSLELCNIDTKRSSRSIKFDEFGNVRYSKFVNYYRNLEKKGKGFTFKYNLTNPDSFTFDCTDYHSDFQIYVSTSTYHDEIKFGGSSYILSKPDYSKRIKYSSPINDKWSMTLDLYLNSDNTIKYCNVDIRTHKSNGKVNGIHTLRISQDKTPGSFTARHISRKGILVEDYTKELSSALKEYLVYDKNGNVSLESLIPLMHAVGFKSTDYANRKLWTCVNDIRSIVDASGVAYRCLSEVKGEIPLPELKSRVESFIGSSQKTSKKTKVRTLLR